jgi:hypothetical protein
MANKTYLPQIQRRVVNRPNYTYHVLQYDLDNAYPQRVLELVYASPTAMDAWSKRASYLVGKGFEDKNLNKRIVNKKGLTLGKLLRHTTNDKALFKGFGIHVNYDANYNITEAHYIRFEDIRIGDPDEKNYRDKYGLYFDWGRRTWKNITASKIHYIHRFNPDPERIKWEVEEAGGWDKYKGQVFYFNPEIEDYSLAKCDSVLEDIETEGGLKVFSNRSVRTGFMPSAILTQETKTETADQLSPAMDEMGVIRPNQPSDLEINLGKFQGAEESMKIMSIEYAAGSQPPQLLSFPIQNNDKLFEVTEKSVINRILKGFSIPKELIDPEKASGLTNGSEKKEAIRQMNDQTQDERNEISGVFEKIFSLMRFPQPKNYNIVEMPQDVVEDSIGARAGSNINELILMDIDEEAKVYNLVYTYGFKEEDARKMIPKQLPKENVNNSSGSKID